MRTIRSRSRSELYITPCIVSAIGLVTATFAFLLLIHSNEYLFQHRWPLGEVLVLLCAFGVVVVARYGGSAYRYMTSSRTMEELVVEHVVHCSWEQRSRDSALYGYDNEYITHMVFGSDIRFVGHDKTYRLPTRHLNVGDKTRRIVLQRHDKVWAYRWLDL